MSFSPASLLAQLMRYPSPRGYTVAYSGGCDSHVLLHALVAVRDELPVSSIEVVHIDHGLQAQAAQWEAHCANVCERLQVPYRSAAVRAGAEKGESPEAAAREARYRALAEQMSDQHMLLLAHHQDDQAETLLLQLLRGSGVRGLAAMPELSPFGRGWLARPLLFYTRQMLCAYANEQGLQWVEDPSNFDIEFDRNFLRHEVLPAITSRWPSAPVLLSRASEHQAEALGLLNDLAALDWQAIKTADPFRINIPPLRELADARQRNVLRYWIGEHCGMPRPDSRHLERILGEVLTAADDAEPVVGWAGVSVRRFRDQLHLLPRSEGFDPNWRSVWDGASALDLPVEGWRLYAAEKRGAGLAKRHLQGQLEIGFRQGGERVQLPGREHHHALKKLLQQWGVPPWERDRIPLVFIDGQLAQVVGYCVCEPFAAAEDETGVDVILHRG